MIRVLILAGAVVAFLLLANARAHQLLEHPEFALDVLLFSVCAVCSGKLLSLVIAQEGLSRYSTGRVLSRALTVLTRQEEVL